MLEPPRPDIVYPASDGEPMANNTKQFRWIIILADNLTALFAEHMDVFVSGNQNWYPVEGSPNIVAAPDVYVVFGRPKGHRGSYKQWLEGGIPMTVVFEVLSPKNTALEMADKLAFYDEHGVEEYYLSDPDSNTLHGYLRRGGVLRRPRPMDGFVSPRLGIRFDLSGAELVVRYPNGEPFLAFEEVMAQRETARQQAREARQEAQEAGERAAKVEQFADRLKELSRKARRQQATAEELAELDRLLNGPAAQSGIEGP
jgi:Uma2 family endonuclease